MYLMHQAVLIILVVLSLAGVVVTFCMAHCDNFCRKWVWMIFAVATIFFGIWELGACTRPYRVYRSTVYNVISVPLNNELPFAKQVIVYEDEEGKSHTLNVNQHFGCSVPANYGVRHTLYATGPYCGVSFAGIAKYPRERFELERLD